MAATEPNVLATFHGDDRFPVEWEDGERDLFWVRDDLHCPNPLSPLFFDLGGWWLTCDHMFRRFGTPFACDWIAKNVNGHLYTAAIPADPDVRAEANEYQARYVPRVPHDAEHGQGSAPISASYCRITRRTSSTGGASGSGLRSSATSRTSTGVTWRQWPSSSSPSCSRTRSTFTIATGRFTGC